MQINEKSISSQISLYYDMSNTTQTENNNHSLIITIKKMFQEIHVVDFDVFFMLIYNAREKFDVTKNSSITKKLHWTTVNNESYGPLVIIM